MSAATWLEELARRRVRVSAEGDRLRVTAPRGALSDAEVAELRARKPEIIAALGSGPRLTESDSLGDAAIEQVRETIGAVLLRSRALGYVWLARDDRAAVEIRAEEADWERTGEPSIPVIIFAEVPHLRDMSPEMQRAFLAVRSEFPSSGIVQ